MTYRIILWNKRRHLPIALGTPATLETFNQMNGLAVYLDGNRLTPPQFRVLARSLPVPSGSTATAGGGVMFRLSMVDRIQPAVPSPPQANIRRFGTFLYSSSLARRKEEQMPNIRRNIKGKKICILHILLAIVSSLRIINKKTLDQKMKTFLVENVTSDEKPTVGRET